MRTVEQILSYHRITIADAVKAARLNRLHMPTTDVWAAKHVSEVLTGNKDEAEAVQAAILKAWALEDWSEVQS